jgi:hypothetical protein
MKTPPAFFTRPASRRASFAARQHGEALLHLRHDLPGQRSRRRDEQRRRQLVVLRLRDQVDGADRRVGGLVGDDDRLGRSVDRVDADVAEDGALGERDEDAARPDDLVDAREGLRAIGERRDRLGAGGGEDAVDAGDRGGGEFYVRYAPVRSCGADENDVFDAGNSRRYDRVQHG